LTHLFGTDPLNTPQRDAWKLESGEWVLDRDRKADHVSGSPIHTLEGYSEIDFNALIERLFQKAVDQTSQNRFGPGVEMFETYLKLDILNHYNRVPDVPDTVTEMKRRVLRERLHELETLADSFPQTNEVKIALLRAYHLLGERPVTLPLGFIEGVSPEKPQELHDLSDFAFRLGLTETSLRFYLNAMDLNLFWRRAMDFELERAARGTLPSPDPPLTFDQSMQMALRLVRGEQWEKAAEILAHALGQMVEFQRTIQHLQDCPPGEAREFRLDQILPQGFNPYYAMFTYHDLARILARFQISLNHPDDPAYLERWKIPFDFDYWNSPYRVIGIYVYRARLELRVNGRPLTDLPTSSLVLLELDPAGNEIRRGVFDPAQEPDRKSLVQFLDGYTDGNYSVILTGFIDPNPYPEVESALHRFGAKRFGTTKNFVSYLYLNSVPAGEEGIEIVTPDPVNLHFSSRTETERDPEGTGWIASVKLTRFKPDAVARIVPLSTPGRS
jgi:hypothetical protein